MTPNEIPVDTLQRLLTHLASARSRLDSPEARRRADILLSGTKGLAHVQGIEREDYLVAVEAFCWEQELTDVLRDSGVEHAYDYRKEYPQEPRPALPNRYHGSAVVQRTLLGRPVGFPIGVPASVLTANSKWVRFFAEHGFNVLTFKTVRSREWQPSPFPNWVFLEGADKPLPIGINPRAVTVYGDENTYRRQSQAFSMANSFGVPSSDPSIWGPEIRAAVDALSEQQMLIVSVIGTVEPRDPPQALLDDFVRVALLAAEAGAPAIELNLSCPNTLDPGAADIGVKPPLCASVADTVQIVTAVAAALDGAVPLVAKLSYLPLTDLAPLVQAISPLVKAISGINTLQVRVERRRGGPTFGERQLAGLSGIAIRRLAVDFVRSLRYLRNRDTLDYEIIGIGGVMDAVDVYALLAVGADAVQTATAASVNPKLPAESAQLESADAPHQPDSVERIRTILYDDDGQFRARADLAARLELPPEALDRELNELEELSELDLPRRVVELSLAGYQSGPEHSSELDPAIWGPPPAPERMVVIERTTKRRLERERQDVLSRSVAPGEVARRLRWTVAEVDDALEVGPLVYVETSGRRAVPLWQFDEHDDGSLSPLPGVAELKRAFARDVDALDAWVNAPNAALAGETPRDALRAGHTDRVLNSLVAIGAAR
jgi:dihydroorotate dehydrogenase